MILGAYCAGKVHNMLPHWYTICDLSSIILFGAYCVG